MKVQFEKDIYSVTLKPGDTFTVWLDTESEPGKRNALQVELRVKPDGTMEIFTHTNQIKLQDFVNWKSI